MAEKLKNDELNRLSIEDFKRAEKQKIILVLDNVRSLHNVGSVFRTADAFLIEEIHLCGLTGTPPNKEIEKTALGATASVQWRYFENTLESCKYLKEKNYHLYAVEQVQNSIALHQMNSSLNKETALIFGNEVYGVEQAVIDCCDGVIEIPQLGTKHSLNISVSVGIVLWEILRGKFKNH